MKLFSSISHPMVIRFHGDEIKSLKQCFKEVLVRPECLFLTNQKWVITLSKSSRNVFMNSRIPFEVKTEKELKERFSERIPQKLCLIGSLAPTNVLTRHLANK